MNSLLVTGQRFCDMPLDINLANDQLKLWDYKLLESVHTVTHSHSRRQCQPWNAGS